MGACGYWPKCSCISPARLPLRCSLDHVIQALTFLDSQTKPFACPTCNKAFARVYVTSFVEFITCSVAKLHPSDALKRHQISHDPTVAKRQKVDHLPRPRTGQACRACAAAKLKCEDEKPCARCRQKGIDCIYTRTVPPAPQSRDDRHSVSTPGKL